MVSTSTVSRAREVFVAVRDKSAKVLPIRFAVRDYVKRVIVSQWGCRKLYLHQNDCQLFCSELGVNA